MSELTLTLLRLGLLVALWLFVFGVLSALRNDLLGGATRPRQRMQRPAAPLRGRGRRSAHLFVTLGDGTTRRLDLGEQPVSFGRAADNTVILDDDYTSTHHAVITKRERHWVVEDRGSTNGTWIDRRRITTATPLTSGMRVRIGKAEIVVHA